MRNALTSKRFSAIVAAMTLAGTGLAIGAEAAVAQAPVDVNGLLRLLDFFDLNPLF